MITIHAQGEEKTIELSWGGGKHTYREEIGQKTFSDGWNFQDAYRATCEAFPNAKRFSVRLYDMNGSGCTSGWERDAMPGY